MSLQYSWLSVEQLIRIDQMLYKLIDIEVWNLNVYV